MSKKTLSSSIKPRMVIRFLIMAGLMPAVLLLSAGRLNWWVAWIYIGVHTFFTLGSRAIVAVRNPDLLVERGQYQEGKGVKDWDRVLIPIVALLGPLAIWVVAGLDERFSWSASVPLAAQLVALAILVLGYFLASWALVENRFFSAVVRIQIERDHAVVTTGPYRIVRHPGYAGALYTYLAAPILLGTFCALIPAALTIIGLIIRTSLEDQTLQDELTGYQAYTQKTRYRLVPGIW